jgi:hypothetical protein
MSQENGIKLSDIIEENGKHILDSPEKIIFWIKHQLDEQKKNDRFKDKAGNLLFPRINLSKCIISTQKSLTNLCDILGRNDITNELTCFINNGQGNKFFHEILEEFLCEDSIIYGAFFHQTIFHKLAIFENSTFEGNANFCRCNFKDYSSFHGTKFNGQFDFTSCKFEKMANFSNTKFNVHEVKFDNSIFKGEFKVSEMIFLNEEEHQKPRQPTNADLSFRDCTFHKKADFSNLNLERVCNFSGSEFFDETTFINSCFKKKLILGNCKIHNHLYLRTDNTQAPSFDDFECSTFESISLRNSILYGRIDIETCKITTLQGNFMNIKNEAILRLSDSTVDKIQFACINNRGILTFEEKNKIEQFSLENSYSSGSIIIDRSLMNAVTDRKTTNLIKDSAVRNNNHIIALDFKAKEMEFLKNETTKWSQTGILLRLNKLSNRHGNDWWRAVIFTLACWIGFYLLFLSIARIDIIYLWLNGQTVDYTFKLDISNAFKFLWSINLTDIINPYINNLKTNSLNDIRYWFQIAAAVLILIIGKISIAYGIYQTISAFRKYGK